MNKKGFFLPLFVISTLIILSSLTYIIETTKLARQDNVGMQATSIIKSYDESEKIQFYLDQSIKYVSKQALNELYSNAGYPQNNSCRKIPATPTEQRYIILDKSCGFFNPEENFKNLLNEKLKNYYQNYKSQYKSFSVNQKKHPGIIQSFSDKNMDKYDKSILQESELQVKKLQIKEIKQENNNLFVTFSEIQLQIENSPGSYHKFEPKAVVESFDISIFGSLYKAINENCINKKAEECIPKLKSIFSNIVIKEQGNILKIKLNEIIFAIDLNEKLPNY